MTDVADTIDRKIARLTRGATPRVLDLFAGCGGFSTGFSMEGFRVLGGVEIDDHAHRSYRDNHAVDPETPSVLAGPVDVSAVTGADLGGPDLYDVLVGGPPCQAYARIGRAKLREVAGAEGAHLVDDRSSLHEQYLRLVRDLRPVAIVIENVPDILNQSGVNVGSRIADNLAAEGYQVRYTILNAAEYGVPQYRHRFFLIALHVRAGVEPTFPAPTRRVDDLPRGYDQERAVSLRLIGARGCPYYVPAPVSEADRPAVTCEDAIGDLERLAPYVPGQARPVGAASGFGGGRNAAALPSKYHGPAMSTFATVMRAGQGDRTTGQQTRSLPRDWGTFARMKEGDQYPEAREIARQRLQEWIQQRPDPDLPVSERDVARFVPPYDAGKFPNKWRKLERNRPARTLLAHLGHDSYTHIHYDSDQARTITVREAARLQSFPDGFLFNCGLNAAFKQIGNAVPPLMAAALARQLLRSFNAIKEINQ